MIWSSGTNWLWLLNIQQEHHYWTNINPRENQCSQEFSSLSSSSPPQHPLLKSIAIQKDPLLNHKRLMLCHIKWYMISSWLSSSFGWRERETNHMRGDARDLLFPRQDHHERRNRRHGRIFSFRRCWTYFLNIWLNFRNERRWGDAI